MQLPFSRRKREPEPDAQPVERVFLFGYECECGTRLESRDEKALTRAAWEHGRTCSHEIHVEARAADRTYGHPGHFHFDDGSNS